MVEAPNPLATTQNQQYSQLESPSFASQVQAHNNFVNFQQVYTIS